MSPHIRRLGASFRNMGQHHRRHIASILLSLLFSENESRVLFSSFLDRVVALGDVARDEMFQSYTVHKKLLGCHLVLDGHGTVSDVHNHLGAQHGILTYPVFEVFHFFLGIPPLADLFGWVVDVHAFIMRGKAHGLGTGSRAIPLPWIGREVDDQIAALVARS